MLGVMLAMWGYTTEKQIWRVRCEMIVGVTLLDKKYDLYTRAHGSGCSGSNRIHDQPVYHRPWTFPVLLCHGIVVLRATNSVDVRDLWTGHWKDKMPAYNPIMQPEISMSTMKLPINQNYHGYNGWGEKWIDKRTVTFLLRTWDASEADSAECPEVRTTYER